MRSSRLPPPRTGSDGTRVCWGYAKRWSVPQRRRNVVGFPGLLQWLSTAMRRRNVSAWFFLSNNLNLRFQLVSYVLLLVHKNLCFTRILRFKLIFGPVSNFHTIQLEKIIGWINCFGVWALNFSRVCRGLTFEELRRLFSLRAKRCKPVINIPCTWVSCRYRTQQCQ